MKVPEEVIVLLFKAGEKTAQTVYINAPTDGVAEGDHTVVISHSVISKDMIFDNALVRNVEVKVLDIDQPTINLIAVDSTGTAVYVDITVSDPRVTLSGPSGRFEVVTEATPTSSGVYCVKFTDTGAGAVLVTMAALNGYAAQDAHTTVLTHRINADLSTDDRYDDLVTCAALKSLYVRVLDNDSASVLVIPNNGSTLVNVSDTSVTNSYSMRLTTQPAADVKIAIFTITDNSEPGKNDFAKIEIWGPNGNVVLFVAGYLHNGNQQAHPENKAPALLQAAAPATAEFNGANVGLSELVSIVAEAKKQWAHSGLTEQQLDQLETLRVDVADLPGLSLVESSGSLIVIDSSAAGYGWFVDPTPGQNEEYFEMPDGSLQAKAESGANGRMDLLTAISHEIGHALGYGHTEAANGLAELMDAELVAGVRELPTSPEGSFFYADAAGVSGDRASGGGEVSRFELLRYQFRCVCQGRPVGCASRYG